jgi:hypothetical protein
MKPSRSRALSRTTWPLRVLQKCTTGEKPRYTSGLAVMTFLSRADAASVLKQGVIAGRKMFR